MTTELRRFHHHFVDVAVDPVFARLDRLNERVTCLVIVFRRVLVLRLIAAADLAAGQAGAQVDPTIALRDALVAHR